MSDIEYLDAVINSIETVVQAASDYCSEQSGSHYHALDERLNELRPLIGKRLVNLATQMQHPTPENWGKPFVNETLPRPC